MSTSRIEQETVDSSSSQPVLSNRSTAIFWALLAFLLFCFYYPCLSGKSDFYVADSCYFFEPLSRFAGEQLRKGIFPFWNPLLYCGMSQAAIPSPSIFYLPSYFLFLLPFSQGLSVYMIFHQLLFAAGAYLLSRDLKMDRPAALFLALSAGLMSYCFSLTRNPTLPATAAWLPLALFLQRKISVERSPRQFLWRLAAASSVAMVIGAGRPEVFLPVLTIVFFAAAFDGIKSLVVNKQFDQAVKASLLRTISFACGLAISCPALLPALEWAPLSPRAHGQTEMEVFSWSANWFDFMGMMFSNPLGEILGSMTIRGTIIGNLVMSKTFVLPFLPSAYVGPIILTFAAWAFCQKQWKYRFAFLFVLLINNMLCAGNLLPLAPFLLKIAPFLSIIRYPVKLMVFSMMLLGAAGALGFDFALKKQITTRQIQIVFGFWLLFAIIATLILLIPNFYFIGGLFTGTKYYAEVIREANVLLATSVLQGSLLGMGIVAATLLFQKNKIKKQTFVIALLTVLAGSLFLSAEAIPFMTESGFYKAKSNLFDYLKDFLHKGAIDGVEGRMLPLYHEGLKVPKTFKENEAQSDLKKFFKYAHFLGIKNTNIDFNVPQSNGYEAAATERFSVFFNEAKEFSTQFLTGEHSKAISDRPLYRFCRLTATQYVLTQETFLEDDLLLPSLDDRYFELFGNSKNNNSRIYRVIKPAPRIYFADSVHLVDSWKELQERLCNTGELPEDRTNCAYLLRSKELEQILDSQYPELVHGDNLKNDSKNELDGPNNTDAPNKSDAPNKIDSPKFQLAFDNGQKMEIDLETNRSELLIISDQNYPGWTAELDNKQLEITTANLFARALFVPAGKHHLVLRFLPSSVITGSIVALIALVVLATLSILL